MNQDLKISKKQANQTFERFGSHSQELSSAITKFSNDQYAYSVSPIIQTST